MKKTDLKKMNGFSLLEVMIVVAILGGISLVVMNLSKQATSSQKKFQTDIDADFITKEISGILASSCGSSQIIGKNATFTGSGAITDINGKYSITSTNGYGSAQIKVDSYQISNTGFPEITDTNTETALVINFAMPKVVSTKTATIKPRRIKLIITKSGSNIDTCKSAWVNQLDYWSKNVNDIFYNSGNVGIGTNIPGKALDVNGTIRGGAHFVSNSSNGALVLNAGPSSAGSVAGISLRAKHTIGDEASYSDLMFVKSNGNVGIGTITPDVALTVQGSAAAPYLLNVGGSLNGRLKVRHIDGKDPGSSAQGELFIQYDHPDNTYINYGGGNVILNATSGNVGIGTVTPTARLEVSGTIKSGAVVVGAGCVPLEAQGYDGSTGAPLYCANTGVWTSVGGGITCLTKSLSGRGCGWRSDGNDRFVYSFPSGNGWYCADYDVSLVDQIHVRCCK